MNALHLFFACRLKTRLRAKLARKRLNSLTVFYFHKKLTYKMPLVNVANKFVA